MNFQVKVFLDMTPRDKLALLKRIQQLIEKEYPEYHQKEMFLKEYNIQPVYDSNPYNNIPEVNFAESVYSMKNSTIKKIANHYNIPPIVGNLHKEYPKEWEGSNNLKCFISHSVKQKNDAHKLKEQLKAYKISGWVAHDDIEPNKYWQEEIKQALNSMDLLIAIITDDFNKSAWCQQEIGFALGRGVEIIKIKYMEADPVGFISNTQACIAQAGKTMQKIVETIRQSKTIGELYAEINPAIYVDDIPF